MKLTILLAFLVMFCLLPLPIHAQLDLKALDKPIMVKTFVQNPTITTCDKSVCNMIINGSQKTWTIKYYSLDPNIDVKVIDIKGNDTINFEVNNKLSQDIPLKTAMIGSVMNFKEDQFIKSGINQIEYKGSIDKLAFEFGENSTTITLNYTYDLEDTYVELPSPNTNNGATTPINHYCFSVGLDRYGYWKWNIKPLLDLENITIQEVKFHHYQIYCEDDSWNMYFYHVYNQTWLEEDITWNNQPCGIQINDSSQCNLTAVIIQPVRQCYNCWANFTITEIIKRDFDLINANSSFVSVPQRPCGSYGNERYQMHSKEGTNKPYLNITYIEQDTTQPQVILTSPENNEYQRSLPIIFNATLTDLGSGIKNASLYHNCNGTWSLNKTNNYSNETQVYAIFNVYMPDTEGCQWNVYACDSYYEGSNCGWATSNFTLKLETEAPIVTFVDPTPNGDLVEPFSNIVINVSVTEPFNESVILDWNGANETLTQCSGKVNDTFYCWIQKSNLQIGAYTFQAFANDTGNYWGATETRNVSVSWNYTFNVQVELDISKNLVITNKTCLNENTLQIVWSEQHTIGGFTDYYQQVQNKYCDWGCDYLSKQCRTDPIMKLGFFIAFLLYMSAITIIPLLVMTRKSKKKKLKLVIDLFLIFVTIVIYYGTSAFLLSPITTLLGTEYSIFITSMIFVMFIFILILFVLFMNNIAKRRY